MRPERLKLGQIVNAVGLAGEVKVYPYTDYKERFSELTWVYAEDEKLEIEKVRYQGGLAVIKFRGIDDRTAAESCKTKYLYIDRENARKLPEDTYYISDLIGLLVETESGEQLGHVCDVIQNTAQDLYEVKKMTGSGKKAEKFLIPAVDEFVLKIDIENQKMVVRLIEGLLL